MKVKEEPANKQARSRVILRGTANSVVAVLGVVLAHWLHRVAFQAGYDVKPELALECEVAAFWLPVLIIAFNFFYVLIGVIRSKHFRLLRIAAGLSAILICLYPFLFRSEFAETPPGWNAFQKRMKEDIRPVDLEVWLRNAEVTNSEDIWRTIITPSDFACFGRTNVNYPPPRLTIFKSDKYTAIEWGSDIQIWSITLGNIGGDRWEGDLYFRYNSK